jgi:CubicO group peptidase (beta-lactamase class C family)
MENLINNLMTQYKITGLSLSVVKDYQIVLTKGYGYKKNKIPVDSNTQFLAGSISKPVFALGCMLLHQSNLIDLDENINKYLKTNFKQFSNYNISLKQLLSHTAGTSIHGFPGYNINQDIPTLTQIINGEKLSNTNKVQVNMIPGLCWKYSGGGTSLAQQTVCEKLNVDFCELMKDLLFDKLNLSCTYSQPIKTKLPNYACGHVQGKIVDGEYHIYPEMAAAGLWTSSKDLAMIGIEICKGFDNRSKIFDQKTIKLMFQPIYKFDDLRSCGIGFFFNGKSFLHDGVDEGFVAHFCFNTKANGIVVMVNDLDSKTFDFINDLTKQIDKLENLQLLNKTKSAGKKFTNKKNNLNKYTGNYTNANTNNTVQIQCKDNQLYMCFNGIEYVLYRESESKPIFIFEKPDGMIIFTNKSLTIIHQNQTIEFAKL